jgi:anti-anti-sigma factor
MKLTVVSSEPSLLRVRLDGQITMMETQEVDRQLEDALGSAGYRQRVLFDLENTTFIDSSGISWLLICHKHFVQAGGKIVFHSAPPLVQQTLNLLRLNLVLNLAPNEDAARAIALEGKQ